MNKSLKTLPNREYGPQLIRSSGSQAANYIEANEALSKKDFFHRVKICRKEAKESCLWIDLFEVSDSVELQRDQQRIKQEVTELKKIFNAICEKDR